MKRIFYFPDEILLSIFDHAEFKVVRALKEYFPEWERFEIELKRISHRTRKQCEELVPQYILKNYYKNMGDFESPSNWGKIIKGWTSLTNHVPLKEIKVEVINDEPFRKNSIKNKCIFYFNNEKFTAIDILSKEKVFEISHQTFAKVSEWFVVETANSVENSLVLFYARKSEREHVNATESKFVHFGIKFLASEFHNMNNLVFTSGNSKYIHVSKISKDEVHKLKYIALPHRVLSVRSKKDELFILNARKLYVWKYFKFIKEFTFPFGHYIFDGSLLFYNDRVLYTQNWSNEVFLFEEKEGDHLSIRKLGEHIISEEAEIYLSTGLELTIDERNHVHLIKPQYSIEELINGKNIYYFNAKRGKFSGYYINFAFIQNKMLVYYQDTERAEMYTFQA